MGAPALQVYVQGQGSVSGDNLNTFAQTTNTVMDLRAFIGTSGLQVFARGLNSVNDFGGGGFYWDPAGVGPDDGVNVIVPNGVSIGCWIRIIIANVLTNTTLNGTTTVTGPMLLPGGGEISATGFLGIGMVPVNVIDITDSATNAPAIVRLLNANGGNASTSEYQLSNGTSITTVKLHGTGFTTSGVFRADGAMISAAGAGGLSLGTHVNQPVYVFVNDTQVASFQSGGPTFPGISLFGVGARICSTSGSNIANAGTLDLTNGTTGGGWSGILVVASADHSNASNRTHTIYGVIARGATATYNVLSTGAAGAGSAFSIVAVANGQTRVTNTSGTPADIDMAMFFDSSA